MCVSVSACVQPFQRNKRQQKKDKKRFARETEQNTNAEGALMTSACFETLACGFEAGKAKSGCGFFDDEDLCVFCLFAPQNRQIRIQNLLFFVFFLFLCLFVQLNLCTVVISNTLLLLA